MLNYAEFVAGIVIVTLAIFDFGETIFIPKGAGFMTQSITMGVANFFKFLSGNIGSTRLLEYKHLIIIVVMIVNWSLFLWFGFTLIYSLEPQSVVNAQTKIPANFAERLYFVGYTISTLGAGDYQPVGDGWEIFTSIISLTGLVIITICITYIVPIVNNIIEKGTLTLRIASLGQSTREILVKGYNGENFEDLSEEFSSLASDIFKYAKNHAAYPVLHHVHNSDKTENTILKLASLDEVCTILMYHIPRDKCLKDNNLRQLRTAITYYLRSVRKVHVPDEQPPYPIDQEIFGAFDFKFINTSDAELQQLYQKLSNRRRLLKGLVQDDGFSWEDIRKGNMRPMLELEDV